MTGRSRSRLPAHRPGRRSRRRVSKDHRSQGLELGAALPARLSGPRARGRAGGRFFQGPEGVSGFPDVVERRRPGHPHPDRREERVRRDPLRSVDRDVGLYGGAIGRRGTAALRAAIRRPNATTGGPSKIVHVSGIPASMSITRIISPNSTFTTARYQTTFRYRSGSVETSSTRTPWNPYKAATERARYTTIGALGKSPSPSH